MSEVSASLAITRALAHLGGGASLPRAEMAEVFGEIMDGRASPVLIAGLLMALRCRGETVDELVGAAAAMRTRATPLDCPRRAHSIDTCGTGGDNAGTVNVSTLAAILVAACGGIVAKHGNRAVSSRAGSADVLEALGVAIDTEPAIVSRCMQVANIGFAFAPRFHAATRHASPVRKELATRTIFNLLGPLTNPAQVAHQVAGVFDRAWCEPMAAALGALGLRRAAVVHGQGQGGVGFDELAVDGPSHVAIWDDGIVRVIQLTPRAFGCDEVDARGLAGSDADHNAGVLRAVLAGREVDRGQRHEAVLHAAAMTAALALELLEPGAFDLDRLPDQYIRASTVARDGEARLVLHRWIAASTAPLDADLSGLAQLTRAQLAGQP